MLGLITKQLQFVHEIGTFVDIHSFLLYQFLCYVIYQQLSQTYPSYLTDFICQCLYHSRLDEKQLMNWKGHPLCPEINYSHHLRLIFTLLTIFYVTWSHTSTRVDKKYIIKLVQLETFFQCQSVRVQLPFKYSYNQFYLLFWQCQKFQTWIDCKNPFDCQNNR